MGLFKFNKSKGDDDATKDTGGFFKRMADKYGMAPEKVDAEVAGERVILKGKVPTREEAEKIIIATGNNVGVAEVESQLEIEEDDSAPEATMYEVQSGDTLGKIAKDFYGDAMKYPAIFEANKPMLSDPDKIYVGQVLRIPPKDVVMG